MVCGNKMTRSYGNIELQQKSIEGRVKNQNDLNEKLTKKVNAIEGYIILLEGKLAISATFNFWK